MVLGLLLSVWNKDRATEVPSACSRINFTADIQSVFNGVKGGTATLLFLGDEGGLLQHVPGFIASNLAVSERNKLRASFVRDIFYAFLVSNRTWLQPLPLTGQADLIMIGAQAKHNSVISGKKIHIHVGNCLSTISGIT